MRQCLKAFVEYSPAEARSELGPQNLDHKLRCINGVIHTACGGAARWSRNGGDTPQPTSFELRGKCF